jgi:hypothetical protein
MDLDKTTKYISGVYTAPKDGSTRYIMEIPSLPEEIIRQLVGIKGYNFINYTKQCGVSYIWHIKNTNKIEIWSHDSKRVEIVKVRLKRKLVKILLNMINNNKLDKNNEKCNSFIKKNMNLLYDI